MHATTGQILDIVEGIDTPLNAHVLSCDICQNKINDFKNIKNKIQNHNSTPPRDMWEKIKPELRLGNSISETSKLRNAIYTMAASILITGGLIVFALTNQAQKHSEHYQSIVKLMVSSNTLENTISFQLSNSQMIQQTNSRAIEMIGWRLVLIDKEIQLTDHKNLKQQVKLWQERVNTLHEFSENLIINNKIKHTGAI